MSRKSQLTLKRINPHAVAIYLIKEIKCLETIKETIQDYCAKIRNDSVSLDDINQYSSVKRAKAARLKRYAEFLEDEPELNLETVISYLEGQLNALQNHGVLDEEIVLFSTIESETSLFDCQLERVHELSRFFSGQRPYLQLSEEPCLLNQWKMG